MGYREWSTCGGGYDMLGTVLADYFEKVHQGELRELASTLELEHYSIRLNS